MKRPLLVGIGMLALLVGLSGVSEAKEVDTYYGAVPGTEDFIAIEVLNIHPGHRAVAFLCNAERRERFSAEAFKANRLNLTSADGSGVRIKAVVSKKQIRGTVRLKENATVRFTAARTTDTQVILRCPPLGASATS
jgi:hypothetical protein